MDAIIRGLQQEGEKALELQDKMEKKIGKIIRSVIGYNRAYEEEDYRQEAYAACFDAELKYRKFKKVISNSCQSFDADIRSFLNIIGGSTKMKKETFCFWFLQKRLYKMADLGEVLWDIFGDNGNYVETLTNKEFRQIKKSLDQKRYRYVSQSAIVDMTSPDPEKTKDIDDFGSECRIWG